MKVVTEYKNPHQIGSFKTETKERFYGGEIQECIVNGEPCYYLHWVRFKDMDGNKIKLWYCSCEDQIAAGCIPTFKEG